MPSETAESSKPVMKERYKLTVASSGHRSTYSDYNKRRRSRVVKRLQDRDRMKGRR